MVYEVTNGVRISVECWFQDRVSKPIEREYLFAYRIRIENGGTETIKILRRHWDILDSDGVRLAVDGEGVLGIQPEIPPGGVHEYSSRCRLRTEMGAMKGHYEVRRPGLPGSFRVSVPEFRLQAPFKLN